MSTHKCPVVPVVLEPHPNADSLSIVRVAGFTVAVRTSDWEGVPLGVYIEPDMVVPGDDRFAFLGEHRRIRVKRLRGIVSQGLLMPAPKEAKVGDDYMDAWGITRYVPPEPVSTGGDCESGPGIYAPVYDVENFYAHPGLIVDGDQVVITEKIHGTSCRVCYREGRLWVGSRTTWKKECPGSAWWKAIRANPEIEAWCSRHQDMILYGEVYGSVQSLRYGYSKGQTRFAGFDILRGNEWLSWADVLAVRGDLPWVPTLFEGSFSRDAAIEMADGDSSMPDACHMREGVVVKPQAERTCPEIGRVILKLVGNRYLEKGK